MDIYVAGIENALKLIFTFNQELYHIIFLSLLVSGSAVFFAGLLGIPLGTWLSTKEFTCKNCLIRFIYVFMGLPPVLVGLLLFLFLSRSGPIAKYIYLLFTPEAMVIAQFILAFPIIIGIIYVAAKEKFERVYHTTMGLGANRLQSLLVLIFEIRFTAILALITAFGRVIAEVGAVMLVGGDIEGKTRVITTAIVLETRKGNFAMALALGLILLTISFIINSFLFSWQYGGKNNDRG